MRQAIQLARRTSKRGKGVLHPFQLLTERPEAKVLQLLEYHSKSPNPELLANLKEIVSKKLVAGQPNKDGRTVVLGVTKDAWTTNGEPGFILVNGEGLEKPLVQEIWLACYADQKQLPLRVSISDGANEGFQYLFLSPERVRMELPAVPAGETTLFSVRTDRTWAFNDRPGTYGVQITTRMKV